MKARQISLGLALTLLIAGCGGSAQTTSTNESTDSTAAASSTTRAADEPATSTADAGTSGGANDVCALLGAEDLAAAAGGSWGQPLDVSEPGQYDKCLYSLDGELAGSPEQSASLDLTVYQEEHLAGVGGVEETFDRYEPKVGDIEIDAGEGAFYDSSLAPIWQVYMLAGGAVVSIVGFSSSADIVFDQESVTAIARTVAGNL